MTAVMQRPPSAPQAPSSTTPLAGVLHGAGLGLVACRALGHAAPVLVHVHVALGPRPLLHVERRLEVGHLAGRQRAHGQADLRDLAGSGARRALPQRGARPADPARPPSLVLDALGEIFRRRPGSAIAAEPRVAHRGLALAPAPLSALAVQEAKAHADPGHLLVRVAPVRVFEDALADAPVGVGQPVGLPVGQGLDVRPADAALFRDAERLAGGFHRHAPGLGCRPPRHALLAQLHDGLRPHLSRHASLLSRSVAWRFNAAGGAGRCGSRGTGGSDDARRLGARVIRKP